MNDCNISRISKQSSLKNPLKVMMYYFENMTPIEELYIF